MTEIPATPTAGVSVQTAAAMFQLSVDRVEALLSGSRGPLPTGAAGERRLTFMDLLRLKSAKAGIRTAAPPAPPVPEPLKRRAAAKASQQTPSPSLTMALPGPRTHSPRRNPHSGQARLDFGALPAPIPLPLPDRRAGEADQLYLDGCALEADDPSAARACYEQSLGLNPFHLDARLNLGRLLHLEGDLPAAERHYLLALGARPGDPTAAFNLAVALEDQGKPAAAIELYRRALAADPSCADAHFNLAGLYEKTGDPKAALRHLREYKQRV